MNIIRITPKSPRARLIIEDCVIHLDDTIGPDAASEIFTEGIYRNMSIRNSTFKIGNTEVEVDKT